MGLEPQQDDHGLRRLRLLFLLPFPPAFEGAHGGARATASMIAALASRHEVGVIYLHPHDEPPIDDALACRCAFAEGVGIAPATPPRGLRERLAFLWDDPEWARRIRSQPMARRVTEVARLWQPDAVHFELHVMGQYVRALAEGAPVARRVLTEHEPGIVAARDHGMWPANLKRRLAAVGRRRGWARFERGVAARMDAVVTFTETDREAILGLGVPRGVLVVCIPLRIALPGQRAESGGATETRELLFVGNFDHPPNIDAAERLATRIYPRVRAAVPDATLSIVGANPPARLRALDGAGVRVTGWVEDVAPYLDRAALVVTPLRKGGGMRVKALDACAAAKALVASSRAIEGLSLQDGLHFMRAESDDDFVAAAIELLNDPERRGRLGAAAYEWARGSQDVAAWVAEYEALYACLGLGGAMSSPGPTAWNTEGAAA